MEVPDFVGDAVAAVDERAAPEVADAIDARKRHTEDDDDAKKKIIPHFHQLSFFLILSAQLLMEIKKSCNILHKLL